MGFDVAPQVLGIAAALASAAAWPLGAIIFKKVGESVSSLGLNLAKGLLSVVLLTLVILATGFQGMGMYPVLLLGTSGLLGIALGDTFFFEALQDLGAHLLVLFLMLGQVLTILLAVVFLGENPTQATWFGIVLTISGVALALFRKVSGDDNRTTRRGILFGLAAVACMSVAMIITKKGLASVSAIQATFIRMLWGTLGVLALGIVTGRSKVWIAPFKNPRLLAGLFGAVCVATFGGFWLSHVALKNTDVVVANALMSTEPLFALPLAAIFLKERVTWNAVAGAVISVCGVVLICSGY